MRNGYFITGTDTDVGKTWISIGIIEALKQHSYKVGVMKPVSAGCERTNAGLRNEDALFMQRHSNVALDYETINPYAFEAAIAPHIAAADNDQHIDLEIIHHHFQTIQQQSDCVVVEGAGGWLVPLNHTLTMADLASRIQLPIVLVVGMRLGCLNHALLSINAIRSTGLPLAGWVANHIDPHMSRLEDNIKTLMRMIDAPMLGRVPYLEKMDVSTIASHITLPVEGTGLQPNWTI